MKVLYVIDSLVPGGSERSLVQLVPHLVERGVELDIAYLRDRPGLQDEASAGGAGLFCLDAEGRRAAVSALRTIISERRPDLVHTTLFESDIAGRIAAASRRVPVVSSVVNETYGEDHLADPQLVRWKVRAAQAADVVTARLATRLHAVSQQVARSAADTLRYPPDRIDVVPRGRDPGVLGNRTAARRDRARTQLGVSPDTPLVLAVARQEPQKGLDRLLAAFERVVGTLPSAQLHIAGRPGRATTELEVLVQQGGLSDRVLFLGERDDVADLLCAADLFVLPSRREGMPGSVLEAMALEAPIVASDIAPVREVVDGSSAWLVDAADPAALARAIVEALEDPALRHSRVQAALERFHARHTVARSAQGILDFYRRALHDGRG